MYPSWVSDDGQTEPQRCLVELEWLECSDCLAGLGRERVRALVARLAAVLEQRGVALPDPGLSDNRYFRQLALVFRSQRWLKLGVWLCAAEAAAPSRRGLAGPRPRLGSGTTQYALHRHGSLWQLTFRGRQAVLRHEKGLCYVAELLGRPREPVKKLSLAAKYSGSRRASDLELFNPVTGQLESAEGSEPVRQMSLAADEAEARRRAQARARTLCELAQDPLRSQAARAEAQAEWEQLRAYLAKDTRPQRDETKSAGDAVRSALRKLWRTLREPGGGAASPEPVRREFARHLAEYLLWPSGRHTGLKGRQARGELAGCLVYEPPAGVRWSIRAGARKILAP